MRDVARLRAGRDPRVRGDDDAAHANAQPAKIELRWRHVIVPTAPIVPEHYYRRRVPIRAFSDGVDDRSDPRRAIVVTAAGVIGILPVRRYPGHVGEGAGANVVENSRLCRDDVLPIRPVANRSNRTKLRPHLPADV